MHLGEEETLDGCNYNHGRFAMEQELST